VGARVRAIRRERELTLERLARETGVGKGFLCEIEQGLAMPSLTTLSRLARRLEVPLFDLVLQPELDGARAQISEQLRIHSPAVASRILKQLAVLLRPGGRPRIAPPPARPAARRGAARAPAAAPRQRTRQARRP
jgi:transcriptional regulator with XRE-family HTH domain